jgi:hypothetical protein
MGFGGGCFPTIAEVKNALDIQRSGWIHDFDSSSKVVWQVKEMTIGISCLTAPGIEIHSNLKIQ